MLTQNSLPDSLSRQGDELWLKNMKALGLKLQVNTAPFAELLKQANAGQLHDLRPGLPRAQPVRLRDPDHALGQVVAARPTTRASATPTTTPRTRRSSARRPGAARNALARKMSEIVGAYAPILYRLYPVGNAFVHPWVKGYYPASFGFTWKYVDIDLAKRRAASRR